VKTKLNDEEESKASSQHQREIIVEQSNKNGEKRRMKMKIQQSFIYKAQQKTITRTVTNFPLRENLIPYYETRKMNYYSLVDQ